MERNGVDVSLIWMAVRNVYWGLLLCSVQRVVNVSRRTMRLVPEGHSLWSRMRISFCPRTVRVEKVNLEYFSERPP